jgi:hypothetical protein
VTSQEDGRGDVGIFGFRCRRMEKSCLVKMIPSKDDKKTSQEEYRVLYKRSGYIEKS